MPYLKGGERVQCIHMTPDRLFAFTVPSVEVPVTFRFWDREEQRDTHLDTLIVEPDERRFILGGAGLRAARAQAGSFARGAGRPSPRRQGYEPETPFCRSRSFHRLEKRQPRR